MSDLYQQDQPDRTAEELTGEELAFRFFHGGKMKRQVLMSHTNPTGWKLEDLLKRMRDELEVKNARVVLDDSTTAQAVAQANQLIMACLFEAEGYQRRLQAVLNALAPDQGPLGRPRVGLGSKA